MWTDWLTPFRWTYRGILFLLQCTVTLVPAVLCQSPVGRALRLGGKGLDERMLNGWSYLTCRVFGLKVRVRGKPLHGPVLIVSNHVSWIDIQVLHSVAAMSFVAKAEIADWPVFGFLASRGGTIYHRRGSHDSSQGVVEQMLDRLQAGGRVAIFPEGGILPGDRVSTFHARMFKVAVEAGCPVQPVMIRYLRNGARDPEAAFLPHESFVASIVRLMGRPASCVELKFLEPFMTDNRSRKELALQAFEMVNREFLAPVTMEGDKVNG